MRGEAATQQPAIPHGGCLLGVGKLQELMRRGRMAVCAQVLQRRLLDDTATRWSLLAETGDTLYVASTHGL